MGAERRTRVVIPGGGFGGLYVALELEKTLARDPDVEITLVNRENFFLFTHAARSRGQRPGPGILQGPGTVPHVPRS
jgi:2-polyprenyl-6-methoxyphenol hydroxylase-like FAD-dependent oxidoreductase